MPDLKDILGRRPRRVRESFILVGTKMSLLLPWAHPEANTPAGRQEHIRARRGSDGRRLQEHRGDPIGNHK
eukprot:4265680-Prorocentrum_lima.AAC.1